MSKIKEAQELVHLYDEQKYWFDPDCVIEDALKEAVTMCAENEKLRAALSWLASEVERDHKLGRLSIDSEDCAKSARELLDS